MTYYNPILSLISDFHIFLDSYYSLNKLNKMSYFYPSYSNGQSSLSPPVKKRNDSFGLSAMNIISLNKPIYTPSKLTSAKLLDMGPLDKINSIEGKLKSIDNQMEARTELFNSFLSKNNNPNVGIYNPYIGNPILGQNPNKKIETSKSVTRVQNNMKNQPKTRLESIEYQNLLQEQLIQQRKEKLQENNFHINNLIFQEIDEMSDNLELFKIEMFNHVRKLERNQEKLNLGEVLDELTHMREFFKNSLDRQEKKKDRELMMLKEDIGIMKEEMMDNFRYDTKQNRDIFKNMNNELRGYQEAMNNKFDEMDSRQKVQMTGIRNLIKKMYEDKEDDGYDRKERDRRLSYEKNKRKKSDEEIERDTFPKRRGGVIEMPDSPPKRRRGVIDEEDEEEIELEEDDQSRDNYETTNIKEKYNMQRDREKKKELENLKPINTNNNFFK
jgi:hypothetical protein